MSLQDEVSRNVRVLIAARDLSVSEVARRVGMQSQALSKKLNGRVRWNIEDLEAVAPALNVDPSTLVSTAWLPGELAARGDDESPRRVDGGSQTVRPEGLEPPTFWTVLRALVTWAASGSAQLREDPQPMDLWALAA